MPKPVPTSVETLEELENEEIEDTLLDEEEEPVEAVETIIAKKSHKKKVDPNAVKVKPERTEKQKETFEKARLTRLTNIELKKQLKEEEEKANRKKKEELIIKKAVAIKKKEIKQRAILEEISDDDTPVEKIKVLTKKIAVKEQEQKPMERELTYYEKYKFV